MPAAAESYEDVGEEDAPTDEQHDHQPVHQRHDPVDFAGMSGRSDGHSQPLQNGVGSHLLRTPLWSEVVDPTVSSTNDSRLPTRCADSRDRCASVTKNRA